MAHIKKTSRFSHRQVFGNDGRVLHRHAEAGKVYHAPLIGHMPRMKRGLQGWGRCMALAIIHNAGVSNC